MLFSKTTVKRFEALCWSNRDCDLTWCCLPRLSKWAELTVSWREVICFLLFGYANKVKKKKKEMSRINCEGRNKKHTIAGSMWNTPSYILTQSRRERENILYLCILGKGDLHFCVRVHHRGKYYDTEWVNTVADTKTKGQLFVLSVSFPCIITAFSFRLSLENDQIS